MQKKVKSKIQNENKPQIKRKNKLKLTQTTKQVKELVDIEMVIICSRNQRKDCLC